MDVLVYVNIYMHFGTFQCVLVIEPLCIRL